MTSEPLSTNPLGDPQGSLGNTSPETLPGHSSQQSNSSSQPGTNSAEGVTTQRKRSPFSFRSERANWIAVAAIVITLVSLIAGIIVSHQIAADSKEQLLWDQEREFWELCRDAKRNHQPLSPGCAQIVNNVLRPPPFHDSSFFVNAVSLIRRYLNKVPYASAFGSRTSLAFWTVIICGLLTILIYNLATDEDLYGNDIPEDDSLSKEDLLKMLGSFLAFLPLWLRIATLLLRVFEIEQSIRDFHAGLPMSVWFAAHFLALYGSVILYAPENTSIWRRIWTTLSAWSFWGAINQLLMAYNKPPGQISKFALASFSSAWFSTFNHSIDVLRWNTACLNVGSTWRFKAWIIGHCVNSAGGLVFFQHVMLGGPILWMTGDPQLNLSIGINTLFSLTQTVLNICFGLHIGTVACDVIVHQMRHNMLRVQCRSPNEV